MLFHFFAFLPMIDPIRVSVGISEGEVSDVQAQRGYEYTDTESLTFVLVTRFEEDQSDSVLAPSTNACPALPFLANTANP